MSVPIIRQTVRIFPLTKKMREKVKQHGDAWTLLRRDRNQAGEETAMIETVMPVHAGGHPYAVTGRVGIDFNVRTWQEP